MEAVLECCCGLDVHRDYVVACILKGANEQKPEKDIKTFSSLPDGLKKLRSWLEEENCRHAAMESTGVYWQPVYNVLEEAFDETMIVMVVNARHMRNVPGKKTDMKDAEWIAQLLRSGLLNASFIPSNSWQKRSSSLIINISQSATNLLNRLNPGISSINSKPHKHQSLTGFFTSIRKSAWCSFGSSHAPLL